MGGRTGRVSRGETSTSTDADRRRFAVRFISERIHTKAATNLAQRELAGFLGLTQKGAHPLGSLGIQVSVTSAPHPWEMSGRQLRQLQQATRRYLHGYVDARGSYAESVDQLSMDVVNGPAGRRVARFGGSVRGVFFLVLTLLLAQHQGRHILRCPECEALFCRVRRQKYCSPSCTDRALWQAYPKAKKIAARKARYELNGWTLGARGGLSES